MGQLVSTDWLCHHTTEWHLHHHSAASFTLKHRGAEIKTLSACLLEKSVSVCLLHSHRIHSYLSKLLQYTILFLSPYMSMHSWLLMNIFYILVSTCFSAFFLHALFFSWLLHPFVSACHLIFLLIFLSLRLICVFAHLEVKHVLHINTKQYDNNVSAEKTVSMSCTSAWIYATGIMLWKGLWCVCVSLCCISEDIQHVETT